MEEEREKRSKTLAFSERGCVPSGSVEEHCALGKGIHHQYLLSIKYVVPWNTWIVSRPQVQEIVPSRATTYETLTLYHDLQRRVIT